MSDPVRMILRGLGDTLGTDIALLDRQSTDWASITFAGGRHRLRLRTMIDPARLVSMIGEIDFPPRDHLVADIIMGAVTASDDGWSFDVEALTVMV